MNHFSKSPFELVKEDFAHSEIKIKTTGYQKLRKGNEKDVVTRTLRQVMGQRFDTAGPKTLMYVDKSMGLIGRRPRGQATATAALRLMGRHTAGGRLAEATREITKVTLERAPGRWDDIQGSLLRDKERTEFMTAHCGD